ncbi:hypothetical protein Tco_1547321 [Tanacetum coccineum]
MGRISKTVGLRWIPTGKLFTSRTTKVDCKPPHGSNEDITNIYECKQTLDVSAGLVPQRQMTFDHKSSNLALQRQQASDYENYGPAPQLQEVSPPSDKPDTSLQELQLLFRPMYEEYFNVGNQSVSKSSTLCTAEPKNIKEAMADHAWIEAMQEEVHQFDKRNV